MANGTEGRSRAARIAAGVAVGLGLLAACIRWRPTRVEVSGDSMQPALRPGDWAIALPPRRIAVGDVVVVGHPERPGFEIVKRIVAGPGDRAPDGTALGPDDWWVEGDQPASSTDSRHFGPVPRSLIAAKLTLVYAPPGRRGRL